ncbi:hypothetical protein SAMN05192574_105203 [Mucilaginibacter gossypiicola]|uniref:Uncharacterized protein n=1 Tax=Mucilaginibacter gossypiicola TaxID=551995 RepID=A0A1H8LQC0_9SPHI|nr:hypothetical protein SAMN05192574_105203 [Mucilaginibacter gossypiicola]
MATFNILLSHFSRVVVWRAVFRTNKRHKQPDKVFTAIYRPYNKISLLQCFRTVNG